MADVVTLADVRAHLRIPAANTQDDTMLQGFISAATDVIRTECGDVVPTSYEDTHDGGRCYIFLRHIPVLSVENITEGWGYQDYDLDFQEVNVQPSGSTFAYSIDSHVSGRISRRSAGNVVIPFVPGYSNIVVRYTAGRKTVPGAVRLAGLELVGHWYQNSQLRAQMAAGQYVNYDSVNEDFTRASGITMMNQGVPWRVIELLKPYRHMPYIG